MTLSWLSRETLLFFRCSVAHSLALFYVSALSEHHICFACDPDHHELMSGSQCIRSNAHSKQDCMKLISDDILV